MEIAKCVIIVILSAATVICAAGWLLYRISFTALAKYICDKLQPYCYRVDVQESIDNTATYVKD